MMQTVFGLAADHARGDVGDGLPVNKMLHLLGNTDPGPISFAAPFLVSPARSGIERATENHMTVN